MSNENRVIINNESTNKRSIIIDETGTIRYLHANEVASLESLGESVRKRASHVHPTSLLLRGMFYALRWLFGEDGRVGNWTRSWKCLWDVDLAISGGPYAGPFKIRAKAISFEEAWIAEKFERDNISISN